jgi:hypothetical protein
MASTEIVKMKNREVKKVEKGKQEGNQHFQPLLQYLQLLRLFRLRGKIQNF